MGIFTFPEPLKSNDEVLVADLLHCNKIIAFVAPSALEMNIAFLLSTKDSWFFLWSGDEWKFPQRNIRTYQTTQTLLRIRNCSRWFDGLYIPHLIFSFVARKVSRMSLNLGHKWNLTLYVIRILFLQHPLARKWRTILWVSWPGRTKLVCFIGTNFVKQIILNCLWISCLSYSWCQLFYLNGIMLQMN